VEARPRCYDKRVEKRKMETTQIKDLALKALQNLTNDDYFFEYLQQTLEATMQEEGMDPGQLDEDDFVETFNALEDMIFAELAN
jgi:hypothetical protein